MNPFVNFGDRDFSLPKGCKNIIDALRVQDARPIEDIAEAVRLGRTLISKCAERLNADGLSDAARAKWKGTLMGMESEIAELERELKRRRQK